MTNTTAKHRRTKKWSQKFHENKTKLITFMHRSWSNILMAMENLKSRYKKVTLKYQTALGAGLYSGSIEVA